jgi:hypothetical protein
MNIEHRTLNIEHRRKRREENARRLQCSLFDVRCWTFGGEAALPFLRTSILPILSALLLSGCLQLETRIKLNEDGSAVVTERLKILRPLHEIEAGMGDGLETTLETMLSRERAQERAGAMGTGVTLADYRVESGLDGSRQALAVYDVEDLTDLTYVSPFLMRGEHMAAMKISIQPQFHDSWSQVAGILYLKFDHAETPAEPSARLKKLTTLEESPLVRQGYRDIAPIFRDLLRGFKVRVIFENYGEILGTGWHASHLFRFERPTEVDIINYSYGGETGGKTGTHPLDDEEVVADLLKLLLAQPNDPWCRRRGAFLGKHMGRPWFRAVIRPSRPLFDKYFEGKELSFKRRGKRMAEFEEIGETPENRRDAVRKKE